METAVLINQVEQLYAHWGNILVFTSSFIEITPLGFMIPGGGLLAIAGFFAASTQLPFVNIIFFGSLGAWATFLAAYLIGSRTGNWLVNKLHQQRNAAFAKRMLEKHGGMVLISSMLAAPVRFWVAYAAGVNKFFQLKFLTYSFLASLIWVSLWTTVGYVIGTRRGDLETGIAKMSIISWLLIGGAVTLIIYFIRYENRQTK